MSKHYQLKAFTLIELVMITVIVAIVAAVAIARAPDLTELYTRQAAYKIKSDIRYLQNYAVTTQKWTALHVTKDEERYQLYVEDTPGNWILMTDPLTKNNYDVDLDDGDFPGVDLVKGKFDNRTDLAFDPSGKPYDLKWNDKTTSELTSQGYIRLGGNVYVYVEPNTGRVSISE
jgi:Tfp pilus assembly protein FimT